MRSSKLQCSQQFQTVYRNGRRYDGEYMTIFVLKNDLGYNRVGFTVSKKVSSKAVVRNRIKRLLREAAHTVSLDRQLECSDSYDWVINAKRSMAPVNLRVVVEELQKLGGLNGFTDKVNNN